MSQNIKSIYHEHFQSLLKHGIIFWCGDKESIKIFKLQKRVLRIMSCVSKCTSCRQIFKDCSILTVACLYILDMVYYIEQHKQSLEQNAQIFKYDTQRRLDLHVYFWDTDFF
jgi:hypothetical protein